jgi:hypothetical protein
MSFGRALPRAGDFPLVDAVVIDAEVDEFAGCFGVGVVAVDVDADDGGGWGGLVSVLRVWMRKLMRVFIQSPLCLHDRDGGDFDGVHTGRR